jgi:SRSO17 transposase
MVNGLLSELEDHNCWTLAEAAGHASPYRMQHLLSRARVDERQLLDAAADWAAAHLSAGQDEDDVVLIVDETADEKSSADCAGAARQYSGTAGGIAMCQVAVTLTCASPAGHTLIGRVLYLPADWAADEERRELAGVPDEVMFATKPRLATAIRPPGPVGPSRRPGRAHATPRTIGPSCPNSRRPAPARSAAADRYS